MQNKLNKANFIKADSLINLGKVYKNKEDSINYAITFFAKAKEISQKNGNINGIVESSYGLGSIYGAQSNVTKATENYYISLKNAELLNDSANMSRALTGLGLVMFNMNKWNSALAYFQKSGKLYVNTNNQSPAKILIQQFKIKQIKALKDYKPKK